MAEGAPRPQERPKRAPEGRAHGERGVTSQQPLQRADTLGACFSHCGPATVFYFLLEAGEASPGDKPEDVK